MEFICNTCEGSTLDLHYHLEVQANPKKNGTKKPMLFLASMGETGLSHDIFFKFSLGPFKEPNFKEQLQNFEVAASKFNIDRHATSMTSKGQSENLKKCHGIIPFLP